MGPVLWPSFEFVLIQRIKRPLIILPYSIWGRTRVWDVNEWLLYEAKGMIRLASNNCVCRWNFIQLSIITPRSFSLLVCTMSCPFIWYTCLGFIFLRCKDLHLETLKNNCHFSDHKNSLSISCWVLLSTSDQVQKSH